MKQPIIQQIPSDIYFGNIDNPLRGTNLIDPPIIHEDKYNWIRDDSRTEKKVLDFLNNENEYTRHIMEDMEQDVENIYTELLSNIKEDYDSYPFPPSFHNWDSDYYYFTRTIKDHNYPLHCRINMKTQEEEIILDENKEAEGHNTFSLTGFKLNNDQSIMSYGIDLNGSEKYKLKLINIKDKTEIDHNIPDLVYCSHFWYDNTIYYSQGNDQNKMYQVWKYNIITQENEKIYEETEELFSVGIGMSNNREISNSMNDDVYLFIHSSSVETTKIYYFTHHDSKNIHLITPPRKDLKYDVEFHENKFLITTNKDDCRNFKVMTCDINNTHEDNWKEFIPYNEDICIEDIIPLSNYLIVEYKQDGNNFIKVVPYTNGKYCFDESYFIDVDDEIQNIGVAKTIYKSDKIIYHHTSLKKPATLYEYNLSTKDEKILRVKEIPNYDESLYETERIFAKSHDGTMVPMSVIYRKDLFKKDGSNPFYLYGYGSYGITIDPDFRSSIMPLLNRGFVYAIGHVRGSAFLGYKWFEAGKMKNKMNTFLDFIACAEHVINENYTSKKQITIEGRSAGGLLVGACTVLRPDLFKSVIAGVPFVDVMNTMCDPSIPLTIPEWEQWGNPNQQEFYDYIKQYSPYDNIKHEEYPNVLALGGLNDPRVGYWEPAKFIAKLREYDTNPTNLLLLKTEMEQGHFGQTARYKYLKELAFDYSFVLKTYQSSDDSNDNVCK